MMVMGRVIVNSGSEKKTGGRKQRAVGSHANAYLERQSEAGKCAERQSAGGEKLIDFAAPNPNSANVLLITKDILGWVS